MRRLALQHYVANVNTYRAVEIEAGFWVIVWYVDGVPHEVLKRWYTSWWDATANRVYLECQEDRRYAHTTDAKRLTD